jgi:hypothetical protein
MAKQQSLAKRLYTLLHNEKRYLIVATAGYIVFTAMDAILSYSSPEWIAETKWLQIVIGIAFVLFATLWVIFYIYNRDW